MITLTADEARVLGVLVEKATTTPEQYPLSLNAVVSGANQKNNRDPVLTMDENQTFAALEGLRGKGLAVRVDAAGSRVNRYRHQAGEGLHVRAGELAVLAELLLRGPQTLGELRGRASRMHPLESLEAVKEMLRALGGREEPMVRELPPVPGSRAERYVQLLSPNLHPLETSSGEARRTLRAADPVAGSASERIVRLESEISQLKDALRRLAAAVGEPDPLPAGGADMADTPPSPNVG